MTVHDSDNVTIQSKQIIPVWVILCEIIDRVAVRASVRNQIPVKALAPEITAPHRISCRKVTHHKAEGAQINICLLPRLARKLGYRPDGTITGSGRYWIGVVVCPSHADSIELRKEESHDGTP